MPVCKFCLVKCYDILDECVQCGDSFCSKHGESVAFNDSGPSLCGDCIVDQGEWKRSGCGR